MTPRELTRDVRARRQVEAAIDAGLSVVGLSGVLAGEQPSPFAGVDVTRVRSGTVSAGLRLAGLGGMRRSRPWVRELRGLWRLLRLAKTTVRLARAGRRLGRFDIVHVNDLDALPAAYAIAQRSDARLVYDAHELYRFMESDPPRAYTALASAVEGWIGRRAAAVVTNCDLFARELSQLLHLRQPPVVVLNCPDPVATLPQISRVDGPLRVIYQAAADHEGRPVADLIAAAGHAPGTDVAIRLVEVDRATLEREILSHGVADRVRLAEPVDADRLVEGLIGFDVGVIVNRDATPNVALAVPGKLWEYMMAGLASVVPALPGLAFVEELEVGLTFRPGRADELGRRLQELAENRELLARLQQRARELALERFNSVVQARALSAVWGA